MSGKKVFELARDFNMKSKELLDILRSLGIAAATHMSMLDENSIAVVRAKLNKKADGTVKASESFKEIKGTPKTILIKKKVAAPLPDEIQPAPPVEAAEEKSGVELKEEDKKLEENVVRKLKEFRELGGLKDLDAGQSVAEPWAQAAAADLKPEPEVESLLPQLTETPAIAGEPVVIVKPAEEKPEIKGQKKKGIKVIGEVDEDLVIAHKWKGFKVIPKKVKKFKSSVTDRRVRGGSQQAEITKPRKKIIKLYEGITVKEFADLIGHKSNEVIARLIEMGLMVPVNNPIDVDAAVLIADT